MSVAPVARGNAPQPRRERPSPSPIDLADQSDEDRYDAIIEFAEKAASYWRSIAEAAYRSDRPTIEIHCRQVRILTIAAFATVKGLPDRSEAAAA